jgi:hypothetical protein
MQYSLLPFIQRADLEYVHLILMTPPKKLLDQVRDAIRLKHYSKNGDGQPRRLSSQTSHDTQQPIQDQPH